MDSSSHPTGQSQALRDLQWALDSPSLIATSPCSNERPETSQCLATAEDELRNFLLDSSGRNEYRVGRYFERLVLFYLKHVRKVEIVASGLQLQEDGQTVGELDFVFRDESGQLQHWETAVKFYLHFPGASKCGSHFIGPDSRDNFETKLQRIFEHQLPLSGRRFPDIAERHAFVKGRVFYHPEHLPPQTLPAQLSPDHLRGVWIYRRELSWLSRITETSCGQEARAKVLSKPFWLAPEQVDCSSTGESQLVPVAEMQEQLQQHFRESATPRLVSLLAKVADAWRELERVFVVQESWPHDH
ncbi:MAG: DUF1853 family protein [Planctomycetes bacterium]|nr:DUF1853 family protein [Planctomycetota bacterium]